MIKNIYNEVPDALIIDEITFLNNESTVPEIIAILLYYIKLY